jgi:hypothetical protein
MQRRFVAGAGEIREVATSYIRRGWAADKPASPIFGAMPRGLFPASIVARKAPPAWAARDISATVVITEGEFKAPPRSDLREVLEDGAR